MQLFDQFVLPSDQIPLAVLVLVLVAGGMRLFYGAWPWEASKTWYRTRQAVKYVEALRNEKRGSTLQLVGDAADTSSDSFDRGVIIQDQSSPEAAPPAETPPAAGQVQKSSEKLPNVRRRWRKSSQHMHPTRAETAPLTTDDSDGGDQGER